MRGMTIIGAVFFLWFGSPASAQHPEGWVSCEFKWQDAGKPADYQKFMNGCVASIEAAKRETLTPIGSKAISAPSATTEEGRSIQWDQNKAIQKVRYYHAINEMHVCARDAATIALRTRVGNREQVGSAVLSLCVAQLRVLGMEAKGVGLSTQSDEFSKSVLSLVYGDIDSVLRLGR